MRATFKVGGTLTNPTTVTLYTEDSTGVKTPFTGGRLTNPSTGVWEKALSLTGPGDWRFKWTGVGAVEAASEDHIIRVAPTRFP